MADSKITRLAMWSGPRNLSSALMRAWENRADTCVVDEPFYASFLSSSLVRHPMQEQVIASQPTSTAEVIRKNLQNELTDGHTIQFQKHMNPARFTQAHRIVQGMGFCDPDGVVIRWTHFNRQLLCQRRTKQQRGQGQGEHGRANPPEVSS